MDEFSRFLVRKDINHLLLSDVSAITKSIEKDFPDVVKVYSIGETYQKRPINVIELDAKKWLESQMTNFNETVQPEKKHHHEHKKSHKKVHALA